MHRTLVFEEGMLPSVSLDRSSPDSLGAQIARTLREAIRNGQVEAGVRLPPSRDAARQLGVGRNAVVEAYDELAVEGLVETRGRHGSFISPRQLAPNNVPLPGARREQNSISRPAYDWRLGQTSVRLLPLHIWRTACREAGRHLPPCDYGDPRGVHGLREAIAEWLQRERGVVYDAGQIVLMPGASVAVEALIRLLVKPGDICAVETPGYMHAALAMSRAGARIHRIPVDTSGLDVRRAFQLTPKLLHLTPGCQYPTGARLSGQRRKELVQQIQRHGGYLIENDHEFIFDGSAGAPIAASLPENTILVGTFAKAISPALRVGFIAAPWSIAETLTQEIYQSQQTVSWPVQISLQWLMLSGEMRRHLRRVRRHYVEIRQQLLAAAEKDCPGLAVHGREGCANAALSSGHAWLDDLLVNCLRQRGVALQTLQDFGGEMQMPLMGFGHMNAIDLARASSLLAGAWADARQLAEQGHSNTGQTGVALSAHIHGSHRKGSPPLPS